MHTQLNFACVQILRGRCHNEDDYSYEEIDEVKANTLLQPFSPSKEPDASQVTMTSAIRLVNRFCCIHFVSILVRSLPVFWLMLQID